MTTTTATTAPTTIRPLTLTVSQVCALGNFSPAWLYLQWQAGNGPRRVKLGRKTLILAHDFDVWLSSHEAA